MKFKTEEDKQLFLIELNYPLNESLSDEINDGKLYELFLQQRNKYMGALKDFRKSQSQKRNWNVNRFNIMKGIKAFHKSTAGKQFHRQLGRFLATHILGIGLFINGFQQQESFNEDTINFLKAISSFKTHAYIELEYYHPLYEQLDYEDFMEYSYNRLDWIEKKILERQELDSNDIAFLVMITETAALVKSFAEKTGKSVAEVERLWNEAKKQVEKEYGKTESDGEDYYKAVVGILKKMLKLN